MIPLFLFILFGLTIAYLVLVGITYGVMGFHVSSEKRQEYLDLLNQDPKQHWVNSLDPEMIIMRDRFLVFATKLPMPLLTAKYYIEDEGCVLRGSDLEKRIDEILKEGDTTSV